MIRMLVDTAPMLLLASLPLLFPAKAPPSPASGSSQGSIGSLPREAASPSSEPEPAAPVRHTAPPPQEGRARAASEEIDITGTVVIESADGTECVPSSGTLTLRWPGKASHDVVVAAGAWRTRVPEQARWVSIESLILDGRPAGVDEHRLELDERRQFAIRAQWLDPMRLRVIDAETRTDLTPLTIVRRRAPYCFSSLVHPGSYTPDEVMSRGAMSPLVLQLPSTDLPELWFVHAPGHAWGRLEVNRTSDGDCVLALGRGATVEIELANLERLARSWSPGLRLRVHGQREPDVEIMLEALRAMASADPKLAQLFATEDEMRTELRTDAAEFGDHVLVDVAPDASGVTLIEDLSPGPCEAKLVLEDLVVASATADLRPDEMAMVTLHPIELPRPFPPVALAGSIHLPLAWRVARLRLNGSLLDRLDVPSEERGRSSGALAPDPGLPDVFPFDLGPVLPGRWRLSVWGFGVTETVTVPTDGRADVQIRIAEPADVRVTVLDSATGGLIDIDDVRWLVATNESSQDLARWEMSQRAEFFFTFRAPAGNVVLRVADHPYAHTERVTLKPGVNSITLRVARVCGVRLSLTYGSSAVRFPEGEIELREVGGERVARAACTTAMLAEVYAPGPGRYLVTLPPIPGFAPVSPFEVNVPEGQLVEHGVVLEWR